MLWRGLCQLDEGDTIVHPPSHAPPQTSAAWHFGNYIFFICFFFAFVQKPQRILIRCIGIWSNRLNILWPHTFIHIPLSTATTTTTTTTMSRVSRHKGWVLGCHSYHRPSIRSMPLFLSNFSFVRFSSARTLRTHSICPRRSEIDPRRVHQERHIQT